MKFFVLVLLSLNILTIFGAPTDSVDCFSLKKFFDNKPNYILEECCNSNQTVCDEKGNIKTLYVYIYELENY